MIVSKGFLNDNNELLKTVQHDTYNHNVSVIFESARKALLCADAIIGSDLLIVQKARELNNFDHQTLQDTHDIFAMCFRYKNDDGCQLNHSESVSKQHNRYQCEWNEWLNSQLLRLVEYPQFVRSVIEAVVFSNNELGYMAEKRVCKLVLSFFDAKDWAFEDGYLKAYGELNV